MSLCCMCRPQAAARGSGAAGDSGWQAPEAPFTIDTVEHQPIMHPVWPSLPKLDAVRPDPPPAPMLWNWNLINTGKLTFRVSQRDVKGCSVDYLRRLRGCPCAQLGTARARGPVSSRLRTGSSSTVSMIVSPLPELEVLCARLDSRVMGG